MESWESKIDRVSEPLLASSCSNGRKIAFATSKRRSCALVVGLCCLLSFTWLTLSLRFGDDLHNGSERPSINGRCAQVPALQPRHQTPELSHMDQYIQSDAFRNLSVSRLSRAVQIRTESFDDLGLVGKDKRWDVMYDFAAFLESTFPQTHATLSLEKINTHGLLYTWQGENQNLKPTLLMAHQDVVPVPESTVNAWTHPPFSGYFDGEFIWGRGASDCKNQLIGDLEVIEELVNAGFQPRRTVILSFGFDEEISGWQGASHLASFLERRYGHGGISAIIDEGSGFDKPWGMQIALPGVGEKGYTDVSITVRMPGGHSSIPPDHTGIGVMSELISAIEADKYRTHLDDNNPFLGLLYCGAEYAPKFPSKIKKLLKKHRQTSSSSWNTLYKSNKDHLALEVAKLGLAARYLMQTSIAADIISGGVKVNALPERTTAIINHRVNIGEHTLDVHNKITRIAKKVAEKYDLDLHAFDNTTESPSSITLFNASPVLEPAPISPTDGRALSPWTILSGTIHAIYGEEMIVAPGIMTGNTDTKHYWNLTRHIFRFSPGFDGKTTGIGNIHTVDERMSIDAHVNLVRWTSLFVRNMDDSDPE